MDMQGLASEYQADYICRQTGAHRSKRHQQGTDAVIIYRHKVQDDKYRQHICHCTEIGRSAVKSSAVVSHKCGEHLLIFVFHG